MRPWLVGLTCLAIGGASLLAQGARMGAAGGPPAPGTGIVLGQVVDASTGQPIDSATVFINVPRPPSTTLPGVAPPPMPARAGVPAGPTRLLTDGDGHFVFHDLPAGSFPITVTASGYVDGAYGQTRPTGPSRPIALTDGARLGDVKIRLWKLGAITGTVTDDLGEPAVGILVRAFRRYPGLGVQAYDDYKATTDDRGEYRLAPLVPGDYLVAIAQTAVTMPVAAVQALSDNVMTGRGGGLLELMASGGPPPQPGGARVDDNLLQVSGDVQRVGRTPIFPPSAPGGAPSVYLPEYFPSATVPAQASLLTIASGEEKGGINFQLRVAPTATITGSVAGPNGLVGNAAITLTLVGDEEASLPGVFRTASTLSRADGTFTLLAVPAGQYVLRAVRLPPPTLPDAVMSNPMVSSLFGSTGAPDPTQPSVPIFTQAAVTVAAGNVVVGTLMLREGAHLSGRVEFVGSSPPPRPQQVQSLRVMLAKPDGRLEPTARGLGMTPGPTVDATTQFTTDGYPPGRYTVATLGPLPTPWRLVRAAVNGRDALTSPFEMGSADVDGAVLTYSDKVTQLTGTVRGLASGESAVVLLFPADVKGWVADGLVRGRFKQTPATGTGTYALPNVLPGDYCVVAVHDADVPDRPDAAFFEALAGGAVQVSLAVGDQKSADVTVARVR